MKIIQHKKTFDNLIDEHLFRHCMVEQSGYKTSILEAHGYQDNISDIVQALYEVIVPDICGLKEGERKIFKYDDMSLFKGIKVFFSGFNLMINVLCDPSKKGPFSEGYYNERSFLNFIDGKLVFVPSISIKAVGPDDVSLIRVIGRSIAHEFMHAYNDYEIFIESEYKKRLDDSFLKGYSTVSKNSPNQIENFIDKIIYFTDRSERNAHIGQLKKELENYEGSFIDAVDVTNAIKSTETYKKLMEVMECLESIQMLVHVDDSENGSKKRREQVIKVVNFLTKNNFKRYRPAIDFLKHRVMSAKQKFEEQSTKIAYDVFREKWGKF